MMKCGHAANAKTADGKPCCAICAGIRPGADQPADVAPDLTNRMARCSTCGVRRVPSSAGLAFFEFRPTMDTDRYYCGCMGWS
jgi:hypothetical protein